MQPVTAEHPVCGAGGFEVTPKAPETTEVFTVTQNTGEGAQLATFIFLAVGRLKRNGR